MLKYVYTEKKVICWRKREDEENKVISLMMMAPHRFAICTHTHTRKRAKKKRERDEMNSFLVSAPERTYVSLEERRGYL